jgi:hypothetical protein
VAYKICLPSQMAAIHDVFHVSQLKKCTNEASPHPRRLKCDIQISPRRLIHIYYIRWYITVQTSEEAGTRYRR